MWGIRRVFAVMFPLAALIAGGCTKSYFPVSGPNSIAIRSGNSDVGQQYAQVRLTPQVVNILDEYGARTIANIFGDKRPPPEVKFGIGDVVSVTVFEAAAGGLFIPLEAGVRPGNFITLPTNRSIPREHYRPIRGRRAGGGPNPKPSPGGNRHSH